MFEVAGYALGAGTALLGKEAAMACTVAVEASITEHYNDQIRQLANTDPETHRELIETITKFRDEEQEHHDIGLENGAELAPAYQVFLFACWVWVKWNVKLSTVIRLYLEQSRLDVRLRFGSVRGSKIVTDENKCLRI